MINAVQAFVLLARGEGGRLLLSHGRQDRHQVQVREPGRNDKEGGASKGDNNMASLRLSIIHQPYSK